MAIIFILNFGEFWKNNKIKNNKKMSLDESIYKQRLANIYFEEFKIQQPAIDNSLKKQYLPVFAFDKYNQTRAGIKGYICGGYNIIWSRSFNNKPLDKLNYYEIILPTIPCHLYVDSEVYISQNKDRDINKAHELFVDKLIDFMITCGYVKSKNEVRVLALDSSNEKKVSIHYLFKIVDPQDNTVVTKMFKNNYHCGEFMRKFETHILKEFQGPIKSNPLFFNPEKQVNNKTVVVPIYDSGVYTLHRVFRTYGCSKLGSTRPLIPLAEKDSLNKYVDGTIKLSRVVWLDNLIQYIDHRQVSKMQLVYCMCPDGAEPTSKGAIHHIVDNENKTLDILDPNRNYNNKRSFDTMTKTNSKPIVNKNEYIFKHKVIPMILDEIKAYWQLPNMQLTLVSFDPINQTLLINTDTRICKTKSMAMNEANASHNGNHTFFVVDFVTMSFKQGCHSKSESCYDSKTNKRKYTQSYVFIRENTKKTIIELLDEWNNDTKQIKSTIDSMSSILNILSEYVKEETSIKD